MTGGHRRLGVGVVAFHQFFVLNSVMRRLKSARKPHATFCVSAAAMMLAIAATSVVAAQTLTEPNTPVKSPQPSAAAKSLTTRREKSCAMYGAGFVHVPASDTCVKIGGSVQVDGAVSRSR